MPTVVKDDLPRLITFPIGELLLRNELGEALPEGSAGMYFLHISGVQINYYDPVTSKAQSYPVLALDRRAPQLCADTLARLAEQERKKRELVDGRLAGVARADAQLRGSDEGIVEDTLEDEYEFDLSVMIFPVKTRLRRMVESAIIEQGTQPMRNWLSASFEVQMGQRPLVLIYDERSGRVTAKFSDPWDQRKERVYK